MFKLAVNANTLAELPEKEPHFRMITLGVNYTKCMILRHALSAMELLFAIAKNALADKHDAGFPRLAFRRAGFARLRAINWTNVLWLDHRAGFRHDLKCLATGDSVNLS